MSGKLRGRNLNSRRVFVLDTSVIAEYVDEASPFEVDKLFDFLRAGAVRAYVSPVTISEVIYVASRMYSEAGVQDANREAIELVRWLLALPGVELETISREVAVLAGELRKKFKMALSDIYVIAVGMHRQATPLFLKRETEMAPYENELRKLGVAFWEEIRQQF